MKYETPEIIDIYSITKNAEAGQLCGPGCCPLGGGGCGVGDCVGETAYNCALHGCCRIGVMPSQCCNTGSDPGMSTTTCGVPT